MIIIFCKAFHLHFMVFGTIWSCKGIYMKELRTDIRLTVKSFFKRVIVPTLHFNGAT